MARCLLEMPGHTIERLSHADVARNVALSHSVGWNDVAGEWRALHEAAEVLGVRDGERLLAQGALGDYGAAASLAKMVVAPELQRQGLGARLLDRLLASADQRSQVVGLCATDQGRPLYESRGFAVAGELMILVGAPSLGTEPVAPVVTLADAEPAVELDRRFTGLDRSRALRARFREASAACRAEASDQHGYGLATPQGPVTLVGPLMAQSEELARALARRLFLASAGPVRIDVPLGQASFRAWLVSLGLREHSLRVEMARGSSTLPWHAAERFALASQAWG